MTSQSPAWLIAAESWDLRLTNQTSEWAVVVGATGAIGWRITERLIAKGLGVLAVARTESSLDDLSNRVPGVLTCVGDIRSDDVIDRIRQAIPGPVRMAVNSAGAAMGGTVLDVAPDAINSAIEVKVNGTLRLLRGVEGRMSDDSRLVAIGGNLAYDPIPEAPTAGIGNAAQANLIRQLSRALGPRGVTCHIVAPGPVLTPRLRMLITDASRSRGVSEDQVMAEFRDRSPIGHLVTIDEVAWAVETLLAPEARAMAGGTLLLDAGQRTGVF